MEKIIKLDQSDGSPAASAVLQPKPSGTQVKGHSGVQKEDKRTDRRQDGSGPGCLLIHGLRVERYRMIHNSVLTQSALAALKSCELTDYVCQVQELKQQLWRKLGRPRLQETLREGGRLEVTEVLVLDLT